MIERETRIKYMKTLTKLITISALFATIGFVGCAHGASEKSVEILEAKIGELETQVANLKTANDHLCGALAESTMMGMLMYIGEGKFIVRADGTVKEAEGFIDNCHSAMRDYTEEIEKRKALLKAQEDAKAQDAKAAAGEVNACHPQETGGESCSCGDACDCGDACGDEGSGADAGAGEEAKSDAPVATPSPATGSTDTPKQDASATPKPDAGAAPAATAGSTTADASGTVLTPSTLDTSGSDQTKLKIQLPTLK